jgi:hypothetical protein
VLLGVARASTLGGVTPEAFLLLLHTTDSTPAQLMSHAAQRQHNNHTSQPVRPQEITMPHTGWRILVVDSYDVSILGWPAGHPRHELAQSLLAQHNPNQVRSPYGAIDAADLC